MAALAQIEGINLPTTLRPGDLITGSIAVTNVGDEPGTLGVLITTMWDGVEYPQVGGGPTPPGGSMLFTFHEGYPAGYMPGGNAELVLEGRIWLGYDGGYRTDDVKTWVIAPYEEPPIPEPKPWLPLLLMVGLFAYVVLKK